MTGTQANAITARGLTKRFGDTTAVDGVDLTIPEGSVFGLLGPNGAGKTTIVSMLATLVSPDAGQATVLGYDVAKQAHQVRQLIGLTGQYASVRTGRFKCFAVYPRRTASPAVTATTDGQPR